MPPPTDPEAAESQHSSEHIDHQQTEQGAAVDNSSHSSQNIQRSSSDSNSDSPDNISLKPSPKPKFDKKKPFLTRSFRARLDTPRSRHRKDHQRQAIKKYNVSPPKAFKFSDPTLKVSMPHLPEAASNKATDILKTLHKGNYITKEQFESALDSVYLPPVQSHPAQQFPFNTSTAPVTGTATATATGASIMASNSPTKPNAKVSELTEQLRKMRLENAQLASASQQWQSKYQAVKNQINVKVTPTSTDPTIMYDPDSTIFLLPNDIVGDSIDPDTLTGVAKEKLYKYKSDRRQYLNMSRTVMSIEEEEPNARSAETKVVLTEMRSQLVELYQSVQKLSTQLIKMRDIRSAQKPELRMPTFSQDPTPLDTRDVEALCHRATKEPDEQKRLTEIWSKLAYYAESKPLDEQSFKICLQGLLTGKLYEFMTNYMEEPVKVIRDKLAERFLTENKLTDAMSTYRTFEREEKEKIHQTYSRLLTICEDVAKLYDESERDIHIEHMIREKLFKCTRKHAQKALLEYNNKMTIQGIHPSIRDLLNKIEELEEAAEDQNKNVLKLFNIETILESQPFKRIEEKLETLSSAIKVDNSNGNDSECHAALQRPLARGDFKPSDIRRATSPSFHQSRQSSPSPPPAPRSSAMQTQYRPKERSRAEQNSNRSRARYDSFERARERQNSPAAFYQHKSQQLAEKLAAVNANPTSYRSSPAYRNSSQPRHRSPSPTYPPPYENRDRSSRDTSRRDDYRPRDGSSDSGYGDRKSRNSDRRDRDYRHHRDRDYRNHPDKNYNNYRDRDYRNRDSSRDRRSYRNDRDHSRGRGYDHRRNDRNDRNNYYDRSRRDSRDRRQRSDSRNRYQANTSFRSPPQVHAEHDSSVTINNNGCHICNTDKHNLQDCFFVQTAQTAFDLEKEAAGQSKN